MFHCVISGNVVLLLLYIVLPLLVPEMCDVQIVDELSKYYLVAVSYTHLTLPTNREV